ncbi:hypothetical protein BKA61DRAFT_681098 [Leptodontidium sp. MPI-SDFR-AT-0119]|nr:hypothetical protein BKA61DRAFT_681098 [Leptodontidium sp. MPI-SDFR-AT-0119]
MLGNYAFQDYAVLHWIDHLESSIPLMLTDVVGNENGLGSEAYGSADAGESDISTEPKGRSKHLKDDGFYRNILLVLTYTRSIRVKDETITALGVLGNMIRKARSVLEKLQAAGQSSTLSVSVKINLEQYYGTNWYKCLRHS